MPRRSLFVIGLSLALILGGAPASPAAQIVWSGLVIANNVAQPDEIPPELHRVEGTLKALFGYNQFKLIGQSQKALRPWRGRLACLEQILSLCTSIPRARRIRLSAEAEIISGEKPASRNGSKVSKASPLVIKGPQVGDGQLLLVLVVQ